MGNGVVIIIPTIGKRPEMLADAVDSVKMQTVKAESIIVECTTGKPQYEKLNLALQSCPADTEFITVLCDDDKLAPTFIEKMLGAAREHNADLVYCDYQIFGAQNRIHVTKEWTLKNNLQDNVCGVTMLASAALIQRLGGYDLAMAPYCDFDFCIRAFKDGCKAVKVNEPLWLYRSHPGQLSKRSTEEAALARKRVMDKHGVSERSMV